MDPSCNTPIPKPRLCMEKQDLTQRPVPLPRTRLPSSNSERLSTSDIFRSIGTVSKQISEDVAAKVTHTAKTANEKIEKTLSEGSRFAKGTIERTLLTSRAVRDSVTKSVIEGTKGSLRLRKNKQITETGTPDDLKRSISVPTQDVSLFDNIQFNSPMLDQKKMSNTSECDEALSKENPFHMSNNSNMDNLSLLSSNSDLNADTVSNISLESRDLENNMKTTLNPENGEQQLTYDTPKPSRTNSMCSVASAPEVPERRKKRDVDDFMRQNSLYENWNLPCDSLLVNQNQQTRPSHSTIFEFDPLNTSPTKTKYEGVSNEFLLLESFIMGDTYGTIVANDTNEDSFDHIVESDYFNPPTPPERTDSLFNEDCKGPTSTSSESNCKNNNSHWFVDDNDTIKPISEENGKTSVMRRFSNILKLEKSKHTTQKIEMIERPPVQSTLVSYYCGTMTQVVSGAMEDLFKNSQTRYCVLSDGKLTCYSDPTNSVVKEAIPLESIYSVQVSLSLSSSANNYYCFELCVAGGSLRSARKLVFNCNSASERRNWTQKIAEHLTSGFPNKYTADYTRCGWCYMKEGVSGEWQGAWVMLIRRVLVYWRAPRSSAATAAAKEDALSIVDLRKTRCIVTQDADEDTKRRCPADGTPNLLLDCPHATLYLRFPHERELKGWRFILKLAANNNGSYLHHQQLTKDDVPTIVDKCISFIYAHGSMTEGIYRRAGSSLVLAQLLALFRSDSWAVQLSPGSHSEHDVAGALKRFFRDLPEPLIPQDQHDTLVAALEMSDMSNRCAEYGRVMRALSPVARQTTRKLFAHLHFLHSMAHANKMNAENLAAVWAPTIMPAALTSSTVQVAWSSKELMVVRDLIANYELIWEPTEAERRRETAIRSILLRVTANSTSAPSGPAGDLKAWIYVKDRTNCHQVALTPNKTCADVCIELCEKAKTDSYLLMIEEVICSESMRRIVHIDEVLLDVVLRWGYWDEDDRKDNYLLLTENKMLQDIEAMRHSTSLVCGTLKFASETTKTFKPHMFELKNGKLCYFKDKQGSHKLEEWDVKDMVWYSGHEPRRTPQSRWAITFIPRNKKQKRCKERPWFGHTIAGGVTEDQLKWIGAMMLAEHSVILPTPRLVIT